MATIEELLQFSVTDLRRLGLCAQGAAQSARLSWRRWGRVSASIDVRTDTRGAVPVVVLDYTNNGVPVEQTLALRFIPSNLSRGGYYYFVCPVTGRSCRKLYFVGGRFVSRFAFRALYAKQAHSQTERRRGLFAVLTAARDFEAVDGQRFRKYHYRGRLTPYGRRVERLAERFQRAGELFQQQKQQPTTTIRTTQDGRIIETTRVYK